LVAVSSQEIVVGEVWQYPIVSSKVCSQMHSLVVSNAAIYLASQKDAVMTFCF
jgi:hypothetical protein